MTLPAPARPPSCEMAHAVSMSASVRIVDCPCPEEDMIGLTTQGIPISFTAAINSS